MFCWQPERFIFLLKELRSWFADAVHFEPDGTQRRVVDDMPTIKNKGRLCHRIINLFEVIRFELIPFRHDCNGVRTSARSVRVRSGHEQLIQSRVGGRVYLI